GNGAYPQDERTGCIGPRSRFPDASVDHTDARNATIGISLASLLRPRHSASLHGGYPCGHHRQRRGPKPGDDVTSILGSAVDSRADTATASVTALGGQKSSSGQPR